MKIIVTVIFAAALVLSATSMSFSQQDDASVLNQVKWQTGPDTGELGSIAEIQLPEGYLFADGDDTRLLMEAMHNPTTGIEIGFVAPETFDWFLVFEFEEVGYIKDDEKNSLDAQAMLKGIRKGTEEGNRIRAERGWAPMAIIGWEQPPRYNPSTNNLEWAIRGEVEGQPVINWNTRLLGRKGVMKVTLVSAPEILMQTLPDYESLIDGFDYKIGNKYAEFRQGDKVAKYGLTALVVGGAAAVAAKSGLLKHLWKLIVFGVVAVGAAIKKIFSRDKA
jgi:uncharacterized membrane-anchored protein